jgi:hypothetical protein
MKSEDEKLVLSLFGAKDLGYVSKPALVRAVAGHHRYANKLLLELFCANPDHAMFEGVNEVVLAPMRSERMKRMAGA